MLFYLACLKTASLWKAGKVKYNKLGPLQQKLHWEQDSAQKNSTNYHISTPPKNSHGSPLN